MWVEFVVGSLTCFKSFFSLGTPVFPSPQKLTFPNSNSTRNGRQRTTKWMHVLLQSCYLPIYLDIKNKREKNIEKNYNHIDKNHIEILTYLALLLNCVVLLLNTKLEKGWGT